MESNSITTNKIRIIRNVNVVCQGLLEKDIKGLHICKSQKEASVVVKRLVYPQEYIKNGDITCMCFNIDKYVLSLDNNTHKFDCEIVIITNIIKDICGICNIEYEEPNIIIGTRQPMRTDKGYKISIRFIVDNYKVNYMRFVKLLAFMTHNGKYGFNDIGSVIRFYKASEQLVGCFGACKNQEEPYIINYKEYLSDENAEYYKHFVPLMQCPREDAIILNIPDDALNNLYKTIMKSIGTQTNDEINDALYNEFRNGKIYKITSPNTHLVYYGSTIRLLQNRFSNHFNGYKKWLNNKNYPYVSSYEIFKYLDASIELVSLCPCSSKKTLQLQEYNFISNNDCVNKVGKIKPIKDKLPMKIKKLKLSVQTKTIKASDRFTIKSQKIFRMIELYLDIQPFIIDSTKLIDSQITMKNSDVDSIMKLFRIRTKEIINIPTTKFELLKIYIKCVNKVYANLIITSVKNSSFYNADDNDKLKRVRLYTYKTNNQLLLSIFGKQG